ncbi:hypothetical protein D043_0526B, partial [Vibrio parahaemolyticus EKP-021]
KRQIENYDLEIGK